MEEFTFEEVLERACVDSEDASCGVVVLIEDGVNIAHVCAKKQCGGVLFDVTRLTGAT